MAIEAAGAPLRVTQLQASQVHEDGEGQALLATMRPGGAETRGPHQSMAVTLTDPRELSGLQPHRLITVRL